MNREKKYKENSFVIIRTKKGNTVGAYTFGTIGYNEGQRHTPTFVNAIAYAEKVDVINNVGGDVTVVLTDKIVEASETKDEVLRIEKFYFKKDHITSIEIHNDFKGLR